MNTTREVSGMKIGIYGGTFNPPHLGHLAAAQAAVDALGLDKLLLIPAALPPHKELPPDTPPEAPADRLSFPSNILPIPLRPAACAFAIYAAGSYHMQAEATSIR